MKEFKQVTRHSNENKVRITGGNEEELNIKTVAFCDLLIANVKDTSKFVQTYH